jgi:hypothetical protein
LLSEETQFGSVEQGDDSSKKKFFKIVGGVIGATAGV